MTLSALSVASEVYPLVKTGGLADVAGALPPALAGEGIAVHTLVPGYPAVLAALQSPEVVHRNEDLFGGPARLLAGRAAGLDLFALDAPHLFDRPGGPYTDAQGRDWPDNAQRFAALCRIAAAVARGAVGGYAPDVLHAHDWQAGLAPAFLHYGEGPRPGSVMTVHNLAFQGQVPAHLLAELGLPPRALAIDGVEYYGSIGYLKAGLQLADRITTVSPSYAEEVRTPEGGMGLDGLLRARAAVFSGILNGIDEATWNPATDPHLPARFDARRPARRAADKRALQERLGLATDASTPLFGVVSRLTWQKGMDLLVAALPAVLGHGGQLALLGSGDASLERGLLDAAAAHPGRIGVQLGYDEALAHLIQGGCDALLVPSRFEPCGLTQLCALRYGALPVVSRVGGLADTVIDANEAALEAGVATGFVFSPPGPAPLQAAIGRAAALWREGEQWARLQRNAMSADVGWTRPARRYAALYRGLSSSR
ncbi:MAG: glycogen synthase GlgA [Acidisphaera sp.]|nr:glycogen synthase GlgA [Acidisphaera sp.]